jgi:hypothetical protein
MFGLQEGAPAIQHVGLHLDAHSITVLVAAIIGSTPWLPALGRRVEQGGLSRLQRATAELVAHAGLAATLVLSAMELTAGTYNPFIYFRF